MTLFLVIVRRQLKIRFKPQERHKEKKKKNHPTITYADFGLLTKQLHGVTLRDIPTLLGIVCVCVCIVLNSNTHTYIELNWLLMAHLYIENN